ncbi:MAG: ribosome-associated translation inhibitor RaiA [Acetobacteraceae bacterium]|nr:ribosome-associated translation inhibitor RaiA [Acetobacteraceae bacterium]
MHITVAGKQVETGEALQTHVRDGLAAITRKYFDHALEANVTFHRDNRAHFACDINLKAGRNLFMRAEGEAADAHRAFEVAAEHLAKRLRRYRRRVNDHARSLAEERDGAAAPEMGRQVVLRQDEPEEVPGEAEEAAAAETAANDVPHGVVVAEHPAEIARLSVGEAVMRLDLTHAPVLMFRNSASGVLNVVYRRADGHVGWIDAPAG